MCPDVLPRGVSLKIFFRYQLRGNRVTTTRLPRYVRGDMSLAPYRGIHVGAYLRQGEAGIEIFCFLPHPRTAHRAAKATTTTTTKGRCILRHGVCDLALEVRSFMTRVLRDYLCDVLSVCKRR